MKFNMIAFLSALTIGLVGCDSRLVENDDAKVSNRKKMTIEEKLKGDTLLSEDKQDKGRASVMPESENVFDYEIFFLRKAKEYTNQAVDTIDYEDVNGEVYRTIMRPESRRVLFMPSLLQSRAYWKESAQKAKKHFNIEVHKQVYLTILNGYRKYTRNEFNSTKTPFYTRDTPDNYSRSMPNWDTEPGNTTGFDEIQSLLSLPVDLIELLSSEVKVNNDLQYFSHLLLKNNSKKKVIGLMLYDEGQSDKSLNPYSKRANPIPVGKIKLNILPGKTAKIFIPVRSNESVVVIAQVYFQGGEIKSMMSNINSY